jgi:hypothetical protein
VLPELLGELVAPGVALAEHDEASRASPRSSSGASITAASATAGCAMSVLSTSNGPMR